MSLMAGFEDLREGFRLIRQPRLRLFVVVPLLINVLFFVLLFWLAGRFFGQWLDSLVATLPDWLSLLEPVVWFVFALALLFVWVYTFVFMATLIGAPFYGLLAEQVQKVLQGEAPDSRMDWVTLIKLVPRTLARELGKLAYYLPRLLLVLILTLIPVFNAVSPFLWALLSAWMIALEFLDFPSDNNGQKLKFLKRDMAENRWRCLGFGLATWLLTLIPVINLVVMQAAVAGGVRQWLSYPRHATG